MADFLWSIKNGDIDEVKAFVNSQGKDIVNKEVTNGRCPLHYAADYGHTDIIEYLLSMGADVQATDKHGITPLLAAIFEGHTSSVKLLIEKGANKTGKSPDGRSYYECAETDDIKALMK